MRLLHYSSAPLVLDRERQYGNKGAGVYKPDGLWVSVEGEDDWPAWCEGESWGLERLVLVHEVVLKPEANVLIVSTDDALDELNAVYGKALHANLPDLMTLNWPRLKQLYAGLIIAPYQWGRRLDMDFMWYYGWDCASGVIWDLNAIEEVK